jgi:hypothetical protein
MASGSDDTLVVLDDLSVANSSLPSGELGLPYSAQAQGTGGAAPYTWSAADLPPGLSVDPKNGTISGTPTTPGTYTVTITPTDGAGIEAPTPLTIKVKGPNEPPPPNKTPPPSETPPPSTLHETPLPAVSQATLLPSVPSQTSPPPSLQNARQSATRWREGSRLAQISRGKTPTGTTFSFSLNEQATVRFEFAQIVRGRRSGHGCLAATHENMQRKSCSYTVTRGTLSFTGHSGTNNVVFAGRISRTDELKPGRYELIITTTNSTGQRSAPVSLSFTILRQLFGMSA